MKLDVYFHFEPHGHTLARIETLIQSILNKEIQMSAELDVLTAQVHSNTTVITSAITLINGLAQRIQDLIDAGANPAAFQALADELKAKDDELAAAVTANTTPTP